MDAAANGEQRPCCLAHNDIMQAVCLIIRLCVLTLQSFLTFGKDDHDEHMHQMHDLLDLLTHRDLHNTKPCSPWSMAPLQPHCVL